MSSPPKYEIELRAPLHPEIPKDAEPLKTYSRIDDTYYMMQPRLRVRKAVLTQPDGPRRIGAMTMKTMLGRSAGKVIEYETDVEDGEAMMVAFDKIAKKRIFEINGSRKTYTLPLSYELRKKYTDTLSGTSSVELCIDTIEGWKVSKWSEIEVLLPPDQRMLKPAMDLLHDVYEKMLGVDRNLMTETDYVEWKLYDAILCNIARCAQDGVPATYDTIYKDFNNGNPETYLQKVCDALCQKELIDENEEQLTLRMSLARARNSGRLWQHKIPRSPRHEAAEPEGKSENILHVPWSEEIDI
ncbi:MAG: hypothetical protein V1887_02225 [Candidatus Aenigmatarchaeota archaeon]